MSSCMRAAACVMLFPAVQTAQAARWSQDIDSWYSYSQSGVGALRAQLPSCRKMAQELARRHYRQTSMILLLTICYDARIIAYHNWNAAMCLGFTVQFPHRCLQKHRCYEYRSLMSTDGTDTRPRLSLRILILCVFQAKQAKL